MDKRLETFLLYFLCAIYSLGALVKLLISVIQNGISVFNVKARPTPPPILNDKRWGNHSYVYLKKQGLKIHYVEKGDRNNPLIVLVHGFPECWLSWRHQLEEFSSKYWVVAMDMRGYGESDKPSGLKNYKYDILVDDIKEFITELGKPKCVLIGHDWGGAVVWGVVDKYPEMFEKHISINGPQMDLFKNLIQTSFVQFKSSWYIFFFNCPFLPEILLRLGDLNVFSSMLRGSKNLVNAFPDDVIDAYKYYYSKKGAFTPPLNYYRAAMDAEHKLKKGQIKVPTLIIWSDGDVAITRPALENLAPLCKDGKFEVIKDSGHFVTEEKPRELNDLILNYLSTK